MVSDLYFPHPSQEPISHHFNTTYNVPLLEVWTSLLLAPESIFDLFLLLNFAIWLYLAAGGG